MIRTRTRPGNRPTLTPRRPTSNPSRLQHPIPPSAPISPSTAMSNTNVPPREIRIKRPRDEAPVPSLYVSRTGSKRLKPNDSASTGDLGYVFRLQSASPSIPDGSVSPLPAPQPTRVPTVLTGTESAFPITPSPHQKEATPPETSITPSSKATDASTAADSPRPVSAGSIGEKRKAPGPIKRFQMTKRPRVRNGRPYSPAPGRQSAVFERLLDEEMTDVSAGGSEDEKALARAQMEANKVPRSKQSERAVKKDGKAQDKGDRKQQAKDAAGKRKKPVSKLRKNEKEAFAAVRKSQRLAEEKAKAAEYGFTDDVISQQMQDMVLEYLNHKEVEAETSSTYPSTPPPPSTVVPQERTKKLQKQKQKQQKKDVVGGGVGGGTWNDVKPDKEEEAEDDDFVYDIYVREEVKPQPKPEDEYGVLVFEGSDDEEWWYEGAHDEDADSDVYRSDDEDSNAEDYHTNDYPDEPIYISDEEDEYGPPVRHSHHHRHPLNRRPLNPALDADSDSDLDSTDSSADADVDPWKPRRHHVAPDDEEYDLADEEDDEDEEAARKRRERLRKGIWKHRERPAVVQVDDSGDEGADAMEL